MDHCWTAERRARHGLPHDPLCKFCCQEPETIDHILVQCAFSRITWHEILSWCRLPASTPAASASFYAWWAATSNAARGSLRKSANFLIALVAWSLWKHHNAAVFDNAQPSCDDLQRTICDEARLWACADAKGLESIIPAM
ncbi:hypothetical protein VPH35_013553 [Triticum aestivum]